MKYRLENAAVPITGNKGGGVDKTAGAPATALDKGRAIFRIVINGSQQAILDELASLDRPLGAIFNSRMATTGRIQMRTASGTYTIVEGDILEYDPPTASCTRTASRSSTIRSRS